MSFVMLFRCCCYVVSNSGKTRDPNVQERKMVKQYTRVYLHVKYTYIHI